MKASRSPWSKVALFVLACLCFLAHLPGDLVHTSIVAPSNPDEGVAAPGNAEEEEYGLLTSMERNLQDITLPKDVMDGAPDGYVALVGASTNGTVSSMAATNRPSAPPEQCWIFMHLQKCGGSTVKAILRDAWGSRYGIYDTSHWKMGDDKLAKIGAKLARGDKRNVMAGGYTEALRRSEPVDARCGFFTLFRHPIARMVSAYYYCQARSSDHACASEVVEAKDVDLLTFAKHWGNFAVRQFALGFVSSDDVQEYTRTPETQAPYDFDVEKVPGWYQLKMYLDRPHDEYGGVSGQSEVMTVLPDDAATPDAPLYDLLQPAMDLISHGYVAVGILEQWNTTLHLFDHALEMTAVQWAGQFDEGDKKNVDSEYKRVEAETLEQAWTNSELKKYMRLDLLLYEHAVDVFHQQAREYGLL